MATSIEAVHANFPRIDQGATWFVDLGWFADVDGVKTPVNLDGYEIRVRLMRSTSQVVLDVKTVTIDDPSSGQFEIRLSKEETQNLPFRNFGSVRFSVRVDLRRTGPDDLETGYKTGEVVALVVGTVTAYQLGA